MDEVHEDGKCVIIITADIKKLSGALMFAECVSDIAAAATEAIDGMASNDYGFMVQVAECTQTLETLTWERSQ